MKIYKNRLVGESDTSTTKHEIEFDVSLHPNKYSVKVFGMI